MVFKVTSSASDSLSKLGSIVLLISLEEKICLDGLQGWEATFSEEEDTIPASLQPRKTPTVGAPSKHGSEQPAVTNGLTIERVRRKILVDDVDQLPPWRNGHDGIISERQATFHEDEPQSSSGEAMVDVKSSCKRPRSLPDFRNYVSEDHDVHSLVSHHGKESVAKEDHRLKSLASISSLQKGSPISRSLNSISDIQGQGPSFRGRLGARADVVELRNKTVELYRFSQTAESGKGVLDKQNGVTSIKRSCVRRLNLDNGNSFSQCSVQKNELQPFVERPVGSVGFSERVVSERASSKLATKKRQSNSQNLPGRQHTSKENTKSVAFSQSRNTSGIAKDLPEGSLQYRIGPETQRVLMSNFGDDIFCTYEKPKADSNERVTPPKSVGVGLPRETCKENRSEINHDADNLQTSEELFTGSQGTMHGDCSEKDKIGQKNEFGSSQRTESLYYNLKQLSTEASAMHKSHIQSQGLKFTKSQIKSMCNVISRLYSSSEYDASS